MINTLINHRYLITSELGRGGMGIVYRAHDNLLERDVAVKVLGTAALGSQGRARLLREAQAAARLNHPNIINIFDAGDANGSSYIVMELLDGESLYEHKPETLEETLRIVRQICDALEHAHVHGIIHRDLKPENVIVTSKGIAKLTDFGLSRSLTGRISQEGIIVGTVYYLAPEQALRQDIDSRADLYALGVMIYELITGRLPFTADDPLGVISQHLNAPVVPPSTYNPNIPPALDGLILRLMHKRPEDRPATAGEVRDLLDRLYEEPEEVTADILAGLSPLDRMTRGRLVGRRSEFDQIKALWREAITDVPTSSSNNLHENVVVVFGESGVGKTPLVKEVRSLAQISGARALTAGCYARESTPYAPIIRLLRDAQPLPEELPDLVIADLMALSPDLAAREVPARQTLTPLSEQQRLFESLFALFSTITERQPLLMVLEDAQWADGNSLFLLRHLARRAHSTHQKMVILLTYRPGETEGNTALTEVLLDFHQERLSKTIPLLPFDREQTRELLSTMFMESINDAFLDTIYRVTEGNLFFIEEICKALIDEGILYCDGGQWHLGGIQELELPQSVRVALQLRINRLPPNAQDVLRIAAIIGREFDYDVLRKACENPDEDELIEALEHAERAQLISEVNAHKMNSPSRVGAPSERFAFAHALIPTTLREELGSLRRRRIHRRVATVFEEVHPDDLETLAYHYGQAGDQDKARLYTARAGDHARTLYANAEALRFYNEALLLTPQDHPDRFSILEGRAQVYDMLAQRDLERADIDAMMNLAEKNENDLMRCDALIAMAGLFLVTENLRAREPAEQAIEIARRLNEPVREGRALRVAGWAGYIHHNFHESVSMLETAVARFRQAGMLVQASECLHILSLVTGMQGLGEQSVSQKFAEDAIQLSRIAGDPRQEAISLRRLAIVYMDRGEYDEALRIGQQALNLHRELGDRHEECMALNAVGVMLSWQRQHDEAREYFQQSFELARAIRSNMGFWIVVANIEWFYFRREGLYEEGLAFADEQLASPYVSGDPFLVTNLMMIKTELFHLLGQFNQALETAREAVILANRHTGPIVQATIYREIAKIYADMHQFVKAHAAMQDAWQLSSKLERPNDLAVLYITDAEISWQEWETGNLKQVRQAAAQVQQAVQLLRGTHWDFDMAVALKTAAWVALAQDDPEKALEYSTEAMKIYTEQPGKIDGFEYVHICALWANGVTEEANELLERAYQRLMQVANHLSSEGMRNCWLGDVYVNRQIVNDWVNEHGLEA